MIENNKIKCPLCRREYIAKIIGPNKLTDEQIIRLMENFENILKSYNEINKNNNRNFLNFNYVIKKLAQMEGLNIDVNDLSENQKRNHDEIWNEIMENMNIAEISSNNDEYCKSCSSKNIVHDTEYGILVCTNCGNILRNVYE